MKRLAIILIISIFVLITFVACSGASDKQVANSDTIKSAQVEYTCPMHHEVIKNEPGKCPECGMELVEKE